MYIYIHVYIQTPQRPWAPSPQLGWRQEPHGSELRIPPHEVLPLQWTAARMLDIWALGMLGILMSHT